MFNIPKLLINPQYEKFNLSETEIYLLKEVIELINIEKFTYSIFAIWSCIVINMQRRIEIFGIENFLEQLENKGNYNKNGSTLKERWLNVNEYQMIKNAKNLNIINNTTYNLLKTIYWLKSDTNNEIINKIEKDEIYSILYLLEKHLFLKEFKKDMRKNTQHELINKQNRRKKDFQIIHNQNHSIVNNHLIEQGVNAFKKESYNSSNEENHIIDEYC